MPELFGFTDVIRHSSHIENVFHIGAHYGEEASEYEELGWKAFWFEGHPDSASVLLDNLSNYENQFGYEALLSDRDDETVDFWVTKYGHASSMLEPKIHQIRHPHAPVVDKIQLKTKRFDNFINESGIVIPPFTLLVLDVQGSELNVWEGMGVYKNSFVSIVCEYSTVEYYKGGPRLSDLDQSFDRYLRVYPKNHEIHEHGDSLYVLKD